MRRKINKPSEVDFIFTADWHLREDTPICRTDDFWTAQWDVVEQVASLQAEYECPVLHAGDLYHHWKPSPYLISRSIFDMPDEFYTVYGQHDLPQHNWDLKHKTGIYTLCTAGSVKELDGGSWGMDPALIPMMGHPNRSVGVVHKFVWDGETIPWPDCDEMTARQVLQKYPDFDVIVTGDHHRPFTYEYKGRLLVNCGCLTRQDTSYMQHRPRVWLYTAKTNTVVPHYLKVARGVISREHIERVEARDGRIQAFIERLDGEWESVVSFEDNLSRFLQANKINKKIVQEVYKAIEV
jgi:DNA repair exonuclease SbcCD nuclease subunit